MQSIQNRILRLVLAITLLTSVAFADGEMGGGGLWGNGPGGPTTVVCTADESQTGNGETTQACDSESGVYWLINSITELLGLNG